MHRPQFLAALTCSCILLALAGCESKTGSQSVSTARQLDQSEELSESVNGPKPPDVQLALAGIDGIKLEISKSDGKLTVVDFWSTSCIPCMQEFPELVALAKDYPEELRCISVNVDYLGLKGKPPESYRERALEFLNSVKAHGVINLLASDTDESVAKEFEYSAIPNVIVYDREGGLLKRFNDANTEGGVSYERDIVPLLEERFKTDSK